MISVTILLANRIVLQKSISFPKAWQLQKNFFIYQSSLEIFNLGTMGMGGKSTITSSTPKKNNSFPSIALNSTVNDDELQRVIMPHSSPEGVRAVESLSEKRANKDKKRRERDEARKDKRDRKRQNKELKKKKKKDKKDKKRERKRIKIDHGGKSNRNGSENGSMTTTSQARDNIVDIPRIAVPSLQ